MEKSRLTWWDILLGRLDSPTNQVKKFRLGGPYILSVVNSSMHTGRTGRDPRVDIFTSVLVSLKAKFFFPFFSRFIRF